MDRLVKTLSETVSGLERTLGLDWRTSYVNIVPAESGRIVLEVSRREVVNELLDGLEGFSIHRSTPGTVELVSDSAGTVEVRLLGSGGETSLWVISSVADLRRVPDHSGELLSQVIMGEELRLLKGAGDWYLVRLRDDYHGWVRSWYLSEVSPATVRRYSREAGRMVRANVAYVLSDPDPSSLPVSDIVSGTRIVALERAGAFRRVALPGGKEGFIREEDLGDPPPGKPDRDRLVGRAKRFLGIPYLWGGTSAKGFDCSGLVQRVFRMEGVELPRDSDMQSASGRPIGRDAIRTTRPGDLLFFGKTGSIDHVSICLKPDGFIHAYGDVRIGSLDPRDGNYEEKLAESLLFARSILA